MTGSDIFDRKLEFGRNWQCNLTGRGEPLTSCNHRTCENGDCVISDWQPSSNGSTPLYMECQCDEGWLGSECNLCCDIPCVEGRGECRWDYNENAPFCNCFKALNYTGPLCETEVNETDTDSNTYVTHTIEEWEIPLVVSTVLIVLLAASLFSTLYVMYRRRHPWLVKYIVQYHARHIDDSDRRYDAFLSYRSSDEADRKFVVFQLLPYLEQEGYTVCIDQRDFIPGAAIANTIAEAIQESKRTIMVLSPAYVEGEWPEFEVQCALRESLKKNHRIIPVIFQSIDSVQEQVSHALGHILESITYLQWPEESKKEKAFWKRLILALPKQTGPASVEIPSKMGEKSIQSQTSQSSETELLSVTEERNNSLRNIFSRKRINTFFAKYRARSVHPHPDGVEIDTKEKIDNGVTVNGNEPQMHINIPEVGESTDSIDSESSPAECSVESMEREDSVEVVPDSDKSAPKEKDPKYVALKMVC